MPRRPGSRKADNQGRRPAFGRGTGSSRGVNEGGPFVPTFVQQVIDPGFDNAGSHTLAGSGIGTSAIAAGVLQITSIDNSYTELPSTVNAPLPAGTYSTVYTILNYVSGSISVASSLTTNLASSSDGTTRSANGTFTENLVLAVARYIGLKGQGAAIVNSMQIDNFTITRVS